MKIGGHQINNWYLIGGGAAILGGYLYWRHEAKASASANSSSADSSGIDPVTGLPYSEDDTVDPLTGMTYLAEAQEYGSVSAAEAALSASQADGEAGYSGDSGIDYPSTSGTTGSTGTTYQTNAQWASAVQAGLVGVGYSSESIATALGQFFASMPESSTSAGIMQVALAEFGPPPQGTYTIITSPTGPSPTGKTHTYVVSSSNADTLATIATRNHNELSSVVSLNNALANKYGTTGKLPVGTSVTLPYAN
jgi:hypothetical protein